MAQETEAENKQNDSLDDSSMVFSEQSGSAEQRGTDKWLGELGYRREGDYYRCCRENSLQETAALFCHGGSASAAIAHMLNLPFPYVCGLLHMEFTGITILRLDRHPGSRTLPCLELVNDARHITAGRYHRLNRM